MREPQIRGGYKEDMMMMMRYIRTIVGILLMLALLGMASADTVIIEAGEYAIVQDLDLAVNTSEELGEGVFVYPLVVREMNFSQKTLFALNLSSDRIFSIGTAVMRMEDLYNSTLVLNTSASLELKTSPDPVEINATPYGNEAFLATENLTVSPAKMVTVGRMRPVETMLYRKDWSGAFSNAPPEYFVFFPVDDRTTCEIVSAYGIPTSMDMAVFEDLLGRIDILPWDAVSVSVEAPPSA